MGFGRLSGDLRTVVIAACVGALASGGPIVAATVVDYARNADRVDGKHAVSASASPATRAGKLIATNQNGRFPNNIIAKAPDAEKLGGRSLSDVVAAARGARTVVVSPVGTDLENGAALRQAVETIDASPGDYLVHIEPGTYDVGASPLTPPDGVALEGSGDALTILTRTGDAALDEAAVIKIQPDQFLDIRDLQIENSAAAGEYAVGVDAQGSVRLQDVEILVDGGDEVVGLRSASGEGVRLDRSRIIAQDATTSSTGISVGGTLLMDDALAEAGCSPDTTGIDFLETGYGNVRGSTVGICPGAGNRAVRNAGSTVRILSSWVDANGSTAFENLEPWPTETLVGGTLVNGTIAGSVTCTDSWDAAFAALGPDCT